MLSKYSVYLRWNLALFLSALLGVLGMIVPAYAACSNPSPLPTGFAAPCPVWSVSASSVPQSSTLTLSATPQAGTDYILTTAYISQGTTWNPYTLAGNNAIPSYSSALASLTLSSTQLSALSLGIHYTVLWDWLWDAAAQCYKGPGLNQCNTGQWRVQSFSVTASYAYAQSAYYVYSQAAYASTPAVSISPTSLTFSSQTVGTTSPVQYLSVTNIGNATLTFTPATISGDFGFGGTASNICSTSLAPGVNCVFGILFKPTIAGMRTGTLTINDNAANSPQTALLNGTGVSTYSYSQSSYYAYSQSVYYAYSQAAYYAYSQSAYTSGTTYYVSPTGNDANTGSLSAPWKTIQHAASTVSAGATVIVEDGTYHETVNISHSGTAASPIVFKSQNKWGAVIAPTGSGNLVTANASYVTIAGFEIVGDGVATYNTGIKFQTGYTNGTATHNKIHRLGLTGCVGTVGILSGQPNSIIDSNLVYDFGEASCSLDEAIYLGDGDGQVVSNNIVGDANYSGSNLIGIQINGEGATTADFPSNTTVVNNTIFNVSAWGISAPCWNIPAAHTCDHNIFNNNIIYFANGNGTSGSIKVINNGGTWGANNTYANNLLNNSGSAYMASGQSLTATIASNPLFVNYVGDGTGDYHLQSTSPAINNGTSTGAPSTDFDGISRPQGSTYDIGAYEYH